MGWNFDQDFATGVALNQVSWSQVVSATLYSGQFPFWADNLQTWRCLDSNGTQVLQDPCANKSSQYWRFYGNSIVNYATSNAGQCLDAGVSSLWYPCIAGDPWQSWQFLGTFFQNRRNGVIIRNRQTDLCLDSGQASLKYACNPMNSTVGNWQQWTVGN
jgi:hypothetical protein